MEWMITADEPGKTYLMQGNEAVARGALEAGIRFAAAYPGSPSSEILTMLGHVADKMEMYAEWSTNETCALEACLGASFARVRSLCVMKQNGLLVVGDALHSASLSGVKGGLVMIVADDPSAHSSTNEFDSRHQAKSAALPMLEPANIQEAKDMVKWGYELSEQLQQLVMVRTVTRINHGRSTVTLGQMLAEKPNPVTIGEWDRMVAINWFKDAQIAKLDQAQEIFEESPFNWYKGPEAPEIIIITCGTGWLYSSEAVEALGLNEKVGILKIGTTYPLPEKFIVKHLLNTNKVLVVEEVDPFLEQNIAGIIAYHPELNIELLGRCGQKTLPRNGELNPDIVRNILASLTGKVFTGPEVAVIPPEEATPLPARELTFCAGCPHRASFFLLKQTLRIHEGQGVVMGDIGCYTMGGQRAGHYLYNFLCCMGGGINAAEGMGQLTRFGFKQPVLALAGDSTFFHSCIPGLVNAKYHDSNMLFVVLDNSATAMTGFQPHPGIGLTAMGKAAEPISIQKVAEAIGCQVTVADPFDISGTTEIVYKLLKQPGLKVLILKQECATLAVRKRKKPRVWVDQDLCRGDECGCGRFCSRIWGCPGNIWDYEAGRAKIDEVVCVGCGVCASLCPAGAIKIEGGGADE
ncbi:MAG TPA: thiamine pyrophosphate-dependent enzyme [Syntrophomonadaceae bacterium]|nr:thiamine pyrophosphate-dependent enzyme [Syntrophomonadaceae bacterium]HPR93909.1 thiamine pyrophosphate-dependent enzyme [Syntrophomonadaceae bacterium]